MMIRTVTIATLVCLLTSGCALLDLEVPATSPPPTAPTTAEVSAGLHDALGQGIATALSTLGRPNGFWGNAAVRIPLPPQLAKAESTLRKFGMGARVDEFQRTLNQAAEEAVPYAAEALTDALRQLTLADAQAILTGGEDAATRHFRTAAGPALATKLRPYVEATTQRVGVTQKYKSMMGDYGALLQRAGVEHADLDDYVTARALDGLFYALAAEEARIRRDPRARTTEIMRRVFGAI